jgi:YD repeat-containing protein
MGARGRLVSACSQWSGSVCVGDQWTYEYDGAGNPTRFDRWNPSTGQVQTVHFLYNGANQVECIDADANGACNGTEFWVYDAHGNLTFDRTTRYVYDAANHLATVCDSGDGLTCDALGNETTYQYNGDGARVAQSVRKGILPATVTTYTLDTALPLTQVLSETTNGQTTRFPVCVRAFSVHPPSILADSRVEWLSPPVHRSSLRRRQQPDCAPQRNLYRARVPSTSSWGFMR